MTKQEKKKEVVDNIKGYEVNKAKEQLISASFELLEAGAIREYNSLCTIIEKLEAWQNRG